MTRILDLRKTTDSDDIFIVLEYVDGDLEDLIASNKIEINESTIIKILYNLLCAMNFLETANVIHRDIKPQNILIDPATLEVKLCDFGLARSDPEVNPRPSTPYNKNLRRDYAKEQAASREERGKRRRDLSNHVATRPYRAPEIIV